MTRARSQNRSFQSYRIDWYRGSEQNVAVDVPFKFITYSRVFRVKHVHVNHSFAQSSLALLLSESRGPPVPGPWRD
ncbi:hypothetical protein GSI_09707 [Ganoderma sinense ZZ0214-1]|uniref:Uncharacterized protein n=1 Tax=Ganoderma sinense ZZ0214-1 TaxID=1077348 RepID=A0A2G8S323_9APHY|nr:hypothetical protein GSI_09707 [Ganoderma sinense ZZ0214-1]